MFAQFHIVVGTVVGARRALHAIIVCVQFAYDAPSRTTHVVTFKLVLSGVTMEGIIKNLKCV